jgi:hypothetical protein
MAALEVAFRLPGPDARRLVFVSDYGLRGGRLLLGDRVLIDVPSAEELARGAAGHLPGSPGLLALSATDPSDVRLSLDGAALSREDCLRAPVSRSAWIHALLAFDGSLFGFVASWLYLRRAHLASDPWATKMALHMAAWHLLLTLALLPLSVFGQRPGIRIVQGTSVVFFFIHVGIALANSGSVIDGPWIALFNGVSGLAFLAAGIYGFRAYADMDPLREAAQPARHSSSRDAATFREHA